MEELLAPQAYTYLVDDGVDLEVQEHLEFHRILLALAEVGCVLARLQPPPLLLGQVLALGENFLDSANAQPRLLKSLFAALAALRGAHRFVTEQLIVAFFQLGALVASCFVRLLLVI